MVKSSSDKHSVLDPENTESLEPIAQLLALLCNADLQSFREAFNNEFVALVDPSPVNLEDLLSPLGENLPNK